jgi:hypothetical protein
MVYLHINEKALSELNGRLYERFDGTVQTGPLRGMKFANLFFWEDNGNICPKLLGCYEFELHAAIDKAISRKPDTIINCGCAEGYYAVGLNRLCRSAKVYANDTNDQCLDQCAKNAMLNGILDMVLVYGRMGARDLMHGTGRKLYFIDNEGYELSVLDPDECPDLLRSDIIVECHDFLLCEEGEPFTSFVSDELRERFTPTHDIDVIEPQIACIGDFPFLRDLPIGLQLLAVMEKRPLPTVWLACWAKQGDNNG